MTDDKEAKANQTAHGLIQRYIGPDHKVIDMKAFFAALVQALRNEGRKWGPLLFRVEKVSPGTYLQHVVYFPPLHRRPLVSGD
jgi:hypothetical protein